MHLDKTVYFNYVAKNENPDDCKLPYTFPRID